MVIRILRKQFQRVFHGPLLSKACTTITQETT